MKVTTLAVPHSEDFGINGIDIRPFLRTNLQLRKQDGTKEEEISIEELTSEP